MRRFLTVLALALIALGALSGTAAAKEGGVELSSTPVGKGPGDHWASTKDRRSCSRRPSPAS
jgi:hypothetical protein